MPVALEQRRLGRIAGRAQDGDAYLSWINGEVSSGEVWGLIVNGKDLLGENHGD